MKETTPSDPPKNKRPRRIKREVIPQGTKTYYQAANSPVLPIEDFYPGCVCALSQLLPEDVDIEKVKTAARLGMHSGQIAAYVGMDRRALMTHFRKTIAQIKAENAVKLLGFAQEAAEDPDAAKKHDFRYVSMLLERQDPAPKEESTTVFLAPLPREILDMPFTDMTSELKALRHNKESD